jgi:probable F420-dependent oxidoreductase
MVVIETDRARALETARKGMAVYLRAPNYVNNLRRLGFSDDDVTDGGSEKLVDAIVACGGVDAAVARVRAHLDAGADHVCVQVLTPDPTSLPDAGWRELAGALGELGGTR